MILVWTNFVAEAVHHVLQGPGDAQRQPLQRADTGSGARVAAEA
jgi:hypothetical protein